MASGPPSAAEAAAAYVAEAVNLKAHKSVRAMLSQSISGGAT